MTTSTSVKISRRAFSLIELSIAITVLGFLIVVVSQGGSLVRSARIGGARSLTAKSPVISIPDLTLWFEAISENSFSKSQPAEGEGILLWKNINPQKKNPLNLDSVPVGNPPTYTNSGINNLPALSFNGTSQTIFALSVSANRFVGNEQATVFVVERYRSGSSSTILWQGAGSVRSSVYLPYGSGSSYRIYHDFGTCCTEPGARISVPINIAKFVNIPKIITLEKGKSSSEIRMNGVSLNITSFTPSGSTAIQPGLKSNLVIGTLFNGHIGEIIIFSRALTTTEVKQVEEYLSQKWRIKLE